MWYGFTQELGGLNSCIQITKMDELGIFIKVGFIQVLIIGVNSS